MAKTNPAVTVSESFSGFRLRVDVSHPFAVGDQVRIGDGKVVWTVHQADRVVVGLWAPKTGGIGTHQYRTLEGAQIARLFHA